jgi:hypothetical protein
MSTLNVYSINGGPVGGMRNALINGNPTINQRAYVSGTATGGANQYTLDRWRVVTTGESITWTDSENIRTVTAPAGGVEQVVEGLNLGTGTYALSWTGTATATVGGVAVANGTTVSITGGVDTTVRFSGGTFSLAQLEPGTRATPFEQRPIGTELALCQRYYQSQYVHMQSPAAAGMIVPVYFSVPMRATPTATLLSSGTQFNVISVSVSPRNFLSAYFQFTGTTANAYVLDRLDAYSAEL